MSMLLNHSLSEATALMRGEICPHDRRDGFSLDGLAVWRLHGLEAAPGHALLDSDSEWESVVRAWSSMGRTWGLCVTGESGEIRWNLVLPESHPAALGPVTAHLTGARLERQGEFAQLASRLQRLSFRTSMAGHSGSGPAARLEMAARSMLGRDFMVLVLATPVLSSGLNVEIHRLGVEEQFVRDEHLSRPGLEQGNHSGAARYLTLVEAARERATQSLQEGGWQVRTLLASADEGDLHNAQSLIHAAYSADGGQPEPVRWQDIADPRALTFLRTAEVAALSRPPQQEFPGFTLETHIQTGGSVVNGSHSALFATAASAPLDGPTIAIGCILNDSGKAGQWLEIGLDDFCRHLLIAGMTGSGKTTTAEHILLELWRDHRKPWLVIEPGINPSYRRLINSEIGCEIRVFALADPDSDHLPMNPLAAPVGIGMAEHISGLFAVLTSAFDLVPPMPEVLATAIEETYRLHGWNPSGRVPDGPAPTLPMLIKVLERHIRTLGYGPEITGNLRAGLLLRLERLIRGPLNRELSSPQPLDVSSLLTSPCIIELSATDADTQALALGFLALQLRHHWRLAGRSDTLRHVTLIEEAHRLLRAVPQTEANAMRSRAVEDVANMLAELRGMGAGLIIVDQTPSALVPSVIANTGTKILHRLDHPTDRELAGRAAGLPAASVDLLGSLSVGNAILRSDRRTRPFRLRLPNPALSYGHLPVPDLPKAARPVVGIATKDTDSCECCGMRGCPARVEGLKSQHVLSRLRQFQSVLQRGDDEIRSWAQQTLRAAEIIEQSPNAPGCFLIALGRVAGLSEPLLNRIRERFVS
jgi:hypothetical protein